MNDLMTWESLTTLGGASFATLAVANTSQHVFGFNPRWFALLIAELIMLGVVARTVGTAELAPYVVALINGAIVYSSAVGANHMTGQPHSESARSLDGGGGGPVKPRRSFRSRWF